MEDISITNLVKQYIFAKIEIYKSYYIVRGASLSSTVRIGDMSRYPSRHVVFPSQSLKTLPYGFDVLEGL